MLTEAQLAAELQISTRQVQRHTAAGMPCQPVGVRLADMQIVLALRATMR